MTTRYQTISVSAGPYATVRAWEKALRLFGENVRLGGIVGPTWGRAYTFVVEVDPESVTTRWPL